MADQDPTIVRFQVESAIASARTTLLVVGVLGVLGLAVAIGIPLLQYGASIFDYPIVRNALFIDGGLVVAWFVCRALAVRNPGPAISAAVVLFLGAWAVSVFLGAPWHAGILVRGLVLLFLGRALMAIARARSASDVDPGVFE